MRAKGFDRRKLWVSAPRPGWMTGVNAMGDKLDNASMVPLTATSLIDQAIANTGLSDFGTGQWREHFEVLTEAVEREAQLHLAGRMLTRFELVKYLEIRLRMVEAYRQSPEIENEQIDRPVFITGYARSGTTILFEVLSQDPQFRVAEKWEVLNPCPPPEAAAYPDPARIDAADAHTAVLDAMTPEFASAHKLGSRLPVESLEVEYPAFISDVYPIIFNVPTYAHHLAKHGIREALEWQRQTYKLLQWRCPGRHWLFKSPSHLPHLREILKVFPEIRVIFTHRDPIMTADSVVSVMGALYWLRTDNPWGNTEGGIDSLSLAMSDERAQVWEDAIELIQSGDLPEGRFANFHYAQFMQDPMAAVRRIYKDLALDLLPEVESRMRAFLDEKTQGKFGKHAYETTPAEVLEDERAAYRGYEQFFNVARES